jgi:hypothetical protein
MFFLVQRLLAGTGTFTFFQQAVDEAAKRIFIL